MRLAIGIFLVVAVLLISESETAVSRGIFKDPAHPGKCVLHGLILDAGKSARNPKKCEQIMCEANSSAQIHSCGVYALFPGQKFGKYIAPNGDYPACCEREVIRG
ncbi:uncharacterized protein LOC108040949 [Drosophila rhopaloa]|uniref:Uncharacterized protein LOC108040949 n=1 Tax=Drosophila rhopaloa TaxID=1041015 RepID=A0A6P4EC75_DRORH|nr:uncharacterized protein LOC108040949 [Drosophila rhopaloa]